MLGEGARVNVQSLVRAPEHNGVQGRTGAFDARTGRWSVLIEPDRRGLALKPAHLTLLCSRADCSVPLMPRCCAVRCARPSHAAQKVWGARFVLSSYSLERLVRAGTQRRMPEDGLAHRHSGSPPGEATSQGYLRTAQEMATSRERARSC